MLGRGVMDGRISVMVGEAVGSLVIGIMVTVGVNSASPGPPGWVGVAAVAKADMVWATMVLMSGVGSKDCGWM